MTRVRTLTRSRLKFNTCAAFLTAHLHVGVHASSTEWSLTDEAHTFSKLLHSAAARAASIAARR